MFAINSFNNPEKMDIPSVILFKDFFEIGPGGF